MDNNIIKICQHCNFYSSSNIQALGKHESNCWANPNKKDNMNTKWECHHCHIQFRTSKEKELHFKGLHDVKKEQICKHCEREWVTTDNFRFTHESKCHLNSNITRYKCKCNRAFINEQKFENHKSKCLYKSNIPEDFNINDYKVNNKSINNFGVYKIITPTGKIYIGMTTDSFKNRWSGHLRKLKNNKHHCAGLQNAFNRYGWNSLEKTIIEEYTQKEKNDSKFFTSYLLKREIEIWDSYNISEILLNGRPTGSGSTFHTEETKEKIGFGVFIANNSSCRIWIKNCKACTNLFTTGKGNIFKCSKCL